MVGFLDNLRAALFRADLAFPLGFELIFSRSAMFRQLRIAGVLSAGRNTLIFQMSVFTPNFFFLRVRTPGHGAQVIIEESENSQMVEKGTKTTQQQKPNPQPPPKGHLHFVQQMPAGSPLVLTEEGVVGFCHPSCVVVCRSRSDRHHGRQQ